MYLIRSFHTALKARFFKRRKGIFTFNVAIELLPFFDDRLSQKSAILF